MRGPRNDTPSTKQVYILAVARDASLTFGSELAALKGSKKL